MAGPGADAVPDVIVHDEDEGMQSAGESVMMSIRPFRFKKTRDSG